MKKGVLLIVFTLALSMLCACENKKQDVEAEVNEGNKFFAGSETDASPKEEAIDSTLINSSVWFGSYEQTSSHAGAEPIEWVVLEDKGDRLLLMSKDVLFSSCYSKDYEDYSWENSLARKYLNNNFLNDAFSSEEQVHIIETEVSDSFGTTNNKVFILSAKEAEKYYPTDDDRVFLQAKASESAIVDGIIYISDKIAESDPTLSDYVGNAQWLLRDYFDDIDYKTGAVVTISGFLSDDGQTNECKQGIRPVIWVEKEAVSLENPYESEEYLESKNDTIPNNSVVKFGRYEQNTENDGDEPIEWLVVEDNGDKVLLMSRFILDSCFYGNDYDDYSWENSAVRQFLNSIFLSKAFSEEEQEQIVDTEVTDTFGTTTDKVFLLSRKEVLHYYPFDSDKQYLAAKTTEYARKKDFCYVTEIEATVDPGSKDYLFYGQWHLRDVFSAEDEYYTTSKVTSRGMVSDGSEPNYQAEGIRPVIWIKKDAIKEYKNFEDILTDEREDSNEIVVEEDTALPDKLILSGNKDDIITTVNYSYIETENYCIFLDRNINVRGNLVKDIDEIIKIEEELTGFTSNPDKNSYWYRNNGLVNQPAIRIVYFGDDRWKGINDAGEKISIYVFGENEEGWTNCNIGNCIVISEECIDFYTSEFGIATFTHEFAHLLQELNSVHLKNKGDKLCEGFAAYHDILMLNSIKKYPCSQHRKDEDFYYLPTEVGLSKETAEAEFICDYEEKYGWHNNEEYALGFLLVKYMKTVRTDVDFNTFLEQLGEEAIARNTFQVTTPTKVKVIKEVYGDDFFEKFGEWYEKNYL